MARIASKAMAPMTIHIGSTVFVVVVRVTSVGLLVCVVVVCLVLWPELLCVEPLCAGALDCVVVVVLELFCAKVIAVSGKIKKLTAMSSNVLNTLNEFVPLIILRLLLSTIFSHRNSLVS